MNLRKVLANVQTVMHLTINVLIDWGILWFLRHGKRPIDISSEVAEYQAGVNVLNWVTGKAKRGQKRSRKIGK